MVPVCLPDRPGAGIPPGHRPEHIQVGLQGDVDVGHRVGGGGQAAGGGRGRLRRAHLHPLPEEADDLQQLHPDLSGGLHVVPHPARVLAAGRECRQEQPGHVYTSYSDHWHWPIL